VSTYRPGFKRQWSDPSGNLDWFNCTMAAGAMALDFDTLGRVDVLPGTLRSHSGDSHGGTGLNSPGLERAWAYYGQVLHVETGGDFAAVLVALRAFRAVVAQGMYGALPKAYRSKLNSIGFTGPHAVALLPEFNAAGDILMGDPLNDRYIWVPQAAIRSFMAALGAAELGSASKLFFAVSDPHKPAEWAVRIEAGAMVRVYTLNSRVGVDCIKSWWEQKWGPKASSALASAPVHRETCDGTSGATTTKVLSGTFRGRHIRVGDGVTLVEV
jgi:hypothetical protein